MMNAFLGASLRRVFIFSLVAMWLNVAVAILLFHFVEGLSFVNAFYFAVTVITTVGFGDFALRDSSVLMKIYGAMLMMTGPTSIAFLMGIITDIVVSRRLAFLLGARKHVMKNHIVVCGLGQLGFRVVSHLLKRQEKVIVIEQEKSHFVEAARDLKAEIIVADARLASSLEKAAAAEAKAIVILTNDDLTNLKIAVNARAIQPDIRVVLRMFDSTLAAKMESAFNIHTVFSSTAIASPAFAMAALDSRKSIRSTFYVGDDLLVAAKVTVRDGSPFVSMRAREFELKYELKLVSHSATARPAVALPTEECLFGAGDELMVVTSMDRLEELHSANEASMSGRGSRSE